MRYVVFVLFSLVVASLALQWDPLNPTGDTLPQVEKPTVTLLPHSDDAYFFGGQKSDFATQTNTAHNDLFHYDISSNHVTKLFPTGSLPAPRIFHGAWDLTGHSFMIAAGGSYDFFFQSLNFFNDFWKYDVNDNRWTQVFPSGDTFPALLSFVVQKTDVNRVFLFGGVNNQFGATGDLYVYKLLQNSVTLLHPDGPTPPARYHAYSFPTVNGFAVFGGVNTNGQYINDMWEYDISSNRWTQIIVNGVTPPDRTHGVTGKHLNKVVLGMGDKFAGGRTCGGAIFPQSPANDTWIFNTLTKQWSQVTVPPTSVTPPLKYSYSITFARRVLAFAGYTFNNDTCAQTHNTNIWEFDIPLVL
jgi:hypothetical protein